MKIGDRQQVQACDTAFSLQYSLQSDTNRVILRQVRAYAYDLVPAGGHQNYDTLGRLFNQARPLNPHLYYGQPYEQAQYMPVSVSALIRQCSLFVLMDVKLAHVPLHYHVYYNNKLYHLDRDFKRRIYVKSAISL